MSLCSTSDIVKAGTAGATVPALLTLTKANHPGLVGPNDVKAYEGGILIASLGKGATATGSVTRTVVKVPLRAPFYATAPPTSAITVVMSRPSTASAFYSLAVSDRSLVAADTIDGVAGASSLSLFALTI